METKKLKTNGSDMSLIWFGLIVCVFGAGLALNVIGLRGSGSSDREALQIVGLIFLSIGAIMVLGGLALLRRPKGMLLQPTGFSDKRMFANEIPWSAVQSVQYGVSANGRWETVAIKVSPEAYAAAKLRFTAKAISSSPEAGIGYLVKKLELPKEEFVKEFLEYANAALEADHASATSGAK
ncbi:hypothetical protein KO498_17225 [Lentibacter algarum]|uniref:hypothetical protein n=1 Tax=Lentibacter algarum TaxID=576131 RepID=UPI001C09F90B|nr:hypothetical protein [Lentibacter algarum]MBU2983552.1 hypothetical protein [Lentibacter algarum]